MAMDPFKSSSPARWKVGNRDIYRMMRIQSRLNAGTNWWQWQWEWETDKHSLEAGSNIIQMRPLGGISDSKIG
jgi:hypothetical protein